MATDDQPTLPPKLPVTEAPTQAGHGIPAAPADMPTALGAPGAEAPTIGGGASTGVAGSGASAQLTPGQEFGGRYHVIRLLGAGGMGAVYQAWDDELGVAVAIKTIRPGTGSTAAETAELERRFKRELVLARQVTHPNVVRIHDLGEVGGTKYITMPYIEGRDLQSVLGEAGTLGPARALRIMRQVVAGMVAAHSAGVVHRDLKPANVMVEEDDRALIMDFGIARSNTGAALTMAGAIVGTIDYMAPEQAMGQPVDQRADVYTLGLIFYDLLVGRSSRPKTDNPLADMMQRIKEAPGSLRAIDQSIPSALDEVVTRCLQPDPAARFQTSAELQAALDALDDSGLPRQVAKAAPRKAAVSLPLAAGVAAALLAAVAGAWWMGRRAPSAPAGPHEPVTVLVADFENGTGDAAFDHALEQMLGLGIEGASFITTYPRNVAQRAVEDIAPGSTLDEERARLVATREGINVILAGRIDLDGGGYRLSVRTIDGATGQQLADETEQASDKAKVMEALGDLSTAVRQRLGDVDVDSSTAGRETFTAANLDAAREYAMGQDLANAAGRLNDAAEHYRKAIELDPNLGRAYAGLATAVFRLGRVQEADELFKKAISLSERMTEREKFRTLGAYYLGPGANDAQAIANFEALVAKYPADNAAWNNLGLAYFNTLDFKKASEMGRKAAAILPKNTLYATNLALYSMYAGEFPAATDAARAVIATAPRDLAYIPLAVASVVDGHRDDALKAFDDMSKTGLRGGALAAMGRADLALYEGRYDEGIRLLNEGVAADEKANLPAQRAQKLVALAGALVATGQGSRAAALVRQALELSPSEAVAVPAGQLLVSFGQEGEARAIVQRLSQDVQKRRRAFAAVVAAGASLKAGRHLEAIDALTSARELADLWLVRFMLGRAYVEAGRFAEGMAEMEACQSRTGEAAAIFLNDVPTLRYLVPVSYWLARAQEGMGMKDAAAKNFAAYLEKTKGAGGDPLAADARKRTSR